MTLRKDIGIEEQRKIQNERERERGREREREKRSKINIEKGGTFKMKIDYPDTCDPILISKLFVFRTAT